MKKILLISLLILLTSCSINDKSMDNSANAQSFLDKDLIWVGTDDGQVQVSDNGGISWNNLTKNIIGPIFVEIIQRKNNFAFGEGNFGALFRSIERDQQRRGYLS